MRVVDFSSEGLNLRLLEIAARFVHIEERFNATFIPTK